VAAFTSEWVAAFTSEWVAGFVGIRMELSWLRQKPGFCRYSPSVAAPRGGLPLSGLVRRYSRRFAAIPAGLAVIRAG
jgi:hypothetical protein